MAAIRVNNGVLAFTSGNSFAVSNIRTPDAFEVIKLPSVAAGKTEKKEKKDDEDGVHSGGVGEGSGNRALASRFSGSGQYWAVCDDLKKLHLYRTDSQPWTLMSSRLLSRRATSVAFTSDEDKVIVADKSGDVYSFNTHSEVKDNGEEIKDDGDGEVKSEGQLLLGHLSMVLDVCLAEDDRYVVTCDRDEKIRMSHFPNAYNIHAFCLGHTQFVSCLLFVEEFRVLISASGDCSVRVWNMQGKQLCQAQCVKDQSAAAVTARQTDTPHPQSGDRGKDGEGEKGDEEKEATMTTTKEERERTSIRGLTYSVRYRLLVVSFYRLKELQVYQLGQQDDHTSLTYVQTISLQHDPWDVTFDHSTDTLWVLSPEEGATLSAFTVNTTGPDTFTLQKVEGQRQNGVSETVRTINKRWPFFSESLQVTSPIPTLWKSCTDDNLQHYHSRKQQRLQGQQQQRQQQRGRKGMKDSVGEGVATADASGDFSGGSAKKKARESS